MARTCKKPPQSRSRQAHGWRSAGTTPRVCGTCVGRHRCSRARARFSPCIRQRCASCRCVRRSIMPRGNRSPHISTVSGLIFGRVPASSSICLRSRLPRGSAVPSRTSRCGKTRRCPDYSTWESRALTYCTLLRFLSTTTLHTILPRCSKSEASRSRRNGTRWSCPRITTVSRRTSPSLCFCSTRRARCGASLIFAAANPRTLCPTWWVQRSCAFRWR
mmetsp:Transcript_13256/g.31365  ORF Transcript_13256/g.31365 Transcript_13256/m.31365 type:complete len:218 (-) Transcript_13256:1460-2113(-)